MRTRSFFEKKPLALPKKLLKIKFRGMRFGNLLQSAPFLAIGPQLPTASRFVKVRSEWFVPLRMGPIGKLGPNRGRYLPEKRERTFRYAKK